jgi:hypothetical protein
MMRGGTLLFFKVRGQSCSITYKGNLVPGRQNRDKNVSLKIILFGTLDHHDERKNPIDFMPLRSKIGGILFYSVCYSILCSYCHLPKTLTLGI